ncbi:MAG: hypothetical protein ABS909_08880 [Arthrobacter sp.]
MTPASTRLTVIGFLGNTLACNDTFKTRMPVFLHNGELAAPTDKEWGMHNIRPLTRWEATENVTRLQRGARISMRVGDLVWLAGAGFVKQANIIPNSAEIRSIDNWRNRIFTGGKLGYGFGTLVEFNDFNRRIFDQAASVMRMAWDAGDDTAAESAYTLITRLRLHGSQNVAAAMAAHLVQMGKAAEYDALTVQAVNSLLFPSEAAFHAAVATLTARAAA